MVANKQITVKIPGKLIFAGEWAILEPGNSCIVLAVNKFLTVKIEASEKIIINSEDIKFTKENFELPKSAINIALKLLKESGLQINNFKISISSQISKIKLKNNSYSKIGLGSSAATVVAIIESILRFHEYKIDNLKLFKLSAIAHYIAQNKIGSGADIACCAYKKNIVYKKFDTNWLIKNLEINILSYIVESDWPLLEIKEINLPENLFVLADFVGYSASTKELVPETLKLKESNPNKFYNIIKKINDIVLKIITILNIYTLDTEQQKELLGLIKQNRILLKELNPKLETPELTQLIESANSNSSVAKFSGAGGGDCGIAICFDKETEQEIQARWNKNNFYPITVFKTL